MKIVVCIKEVVDTDLSLIFDLSHHVVFRKGLPLRLNPNDAAAMALGLGLKSSRSSVPTEITLISIGPERVERYLRQGLALGIDKAVRIWDEGLEDLSAHQKSRLLHRAVSLLGADLIFTGARSQDTENGQVGPLLAAWLNLPCVSEVVKLESYEAQKRLHFIKDIGRGEREVLECSLPAVVTVQGEDRLPYASLDKLLKSQQSEVTLLSLAELGISSTALKDDPVKIIGLSFPRPRLKKVITPESSLPAFERILKLLEGGIAKRQGIMLQGSNEELADQLFNLLISEGVLKLASGVSISEK